MTADAAFAPPILDDVLVIQYDTADELALGAARTRCLQAAASTRAIVAAGVPGRIRTEDDGTLTMSGLEEDEVRWRDRRATGGFIGAEFWRVIPPGRDGAGDMLRHLELRWPVRSRAEAFLPTRLLDLAEIFEAGAEACRLAILDPVLPDWFGACATVLRGAMGGDLSFSAPTPWTSALLQVKFEPDEIPGAHDEEALQLVASRMPASVQVSTPGPRDDHKAVIVPVTIDAGAPGLTAPGTVEMMRALSFVEAMPILREGLVDQRRGRGR